MKKLLPLLFAFSAFFLSAQTASQTFVPDDDFEQALIDSGYDDVLDDYVVTANINTVTELDISNILDQNKTSLDLTGIEAFGALKILNCSNNRTFFTLDTSQLSLLEELNVFDSFVSIDTSNNPELRKLFTGTSFIGFGSTTIDVSQNSKLEELFAGSEVDLSNNLLLKRLSFSEYSISSIDVSNNTELEYLNTGKNAEIRELDLSNNPKLIELRISRSSITTLDLSNNPALESVQFSDTSLQFLNLKNGNNQVLNQLSAYADCVQVDNVAYAEAQTNWSIGTGIYSEDCNFGGPLTYVPDDDFEQALIDSGYDDVLDDYVPTAKLEEITRFFDLSDYNISDFTGLEAMINLEYLNYSVAEGDNSYVSSLNTSTNTKLETMVLRNVKLGALEVSKNHALKSLSLSNSALGALDVSKNPALEYLVVSGSQIESLDLSQNTELTYLIVAQNDNLAALNIKNGANEKLINESVFLTANRQLFCIQVDDYLLSSSNIRWEKDDHASFSTDCDATPGDSDSDGVSDAMDICPNTAPNNPVSPQGCSLAQYTDLVVKNISIGVGSEPCAQGPSGYIEIGVLRTAFDLNVSIFQFENKVFEGVINASNPLFLDGLSGAYSICVSSALAPNGTEFGAYCYEAECGPVNNTLRTSVRIQNPDQVYSIAVSGSKSYEVTVNGNSYTYDFEVVDKQQIDIPLEVGINEITVTGNIDCNGSGPDGVLQPADSTDDLILFPTLTAGKFSIANTKRHTISTISVAGLEGKRVELVPVHSNPVNIAMDLSGITKGMYIVRIVHMSGKVKTAKVIIQ